jgi:NADPH:quinone reductase-like Zn-dependent oxidoreductase
MRAVAVSGFGATPELVELPKPVPGPGELLVRIHAAAYNPFDLKVADGALKDSVQHKFPLILGLDGAGVIEAVGPGVHTLKPGDKVYGQFLNPAKGRGSYAEYAIATTASAIAKMPQGMIFTQAAAVPTASMTAFNMVETARIDAGQRVLVNGATGGVGQSVVQFAANRGAHVIATAQPDAAPIMKDLGAA